MKIENGPETFFRNLKNAQFQHDLCFSNFRFRKFINFWKGRKNPEKLKLLSKIRKFQKTEKKVVGKIKTSNFQQQSRITKQEIFLIRIISKKVRKFGDFEKML